MKTINVVEQDFYRALHLAKDAGMQDIVDALKSALDLNRGPNMKNVSRADIERATGVKLDDVLAYSFYNFSDVPAGINRDKYNGLNVTLLDKTKQFCDEWKSELESKFSEYRGLENVKVLMVMIMPINPKQLYGVCGKDRWMDNSIVPQYDPKSGKIVGNVVLLTPDGDVVARRGWFVMQTDISMQLNLLPDELAHFASLGHGDTEDFVSVLEEDIDWYPPKANSFKSASENVKDKIQDIDLSVVQKQNKQKD